MEVRIDMEKVEERENEILKKLPPPPAESRRGMWLISHDDDVAMFDERGPCVLIGTPGGWLRIPAYGVDKSLLFSISPWAVLALLGIPAPPPKGRRWSDELTLHVVNHPLYICT